MSRGLKWRFGRSRGGSHDERIAAPDVSGFKVVNQKFEIGALIEEQTAQCVVCGKPATHRFYVSSRANVGACKAHIAEAQRHVMDHRR